MNIVKEFLTTFLTISSIVGVIWFFVKQSIWTRYIFPFITHKSKPIITFNDGENITTATVNECFDIDVEIEVRIQKERQFLPKAHIQNPYDNPLAMFLQSPENYRIYNTQRDLYLKSKEQQIKHLTTEDFEKHIIVPLKQIVKKRRQDSNR